MELQKTNKKNVLLLYNMLINGVHSKKDILEKLNIKNSTFAKNIHQLKQMGFNVIHFKTFYTIIDFQNKIKFDEQERTIIAYLWVIAYNFFSKNDSRLYKDFTKKFLQYACKNDYLEVIEKYKLIRRYNLKYEFNEKIKTLKKHIISKDYIKLIFHSNKSLDVLPLEISYKNEKFYLICQKIETQEKCNILIEKIAKIIVLHNDDNTVFKNETIYEIYGKLASTYLLKKHERIVDNRKGVLIIASNEKNKKALFKRLLRYDTLCKVTHGKKDVETFKKIIDKSLKNIGIECC